LILHQKKVSFGDPPGEPLQRGAAAAGGDYFEARSQGALVHSQGQQSQGAQPNESYGTPRQNSHHGKFFF